MEEFRRLKKISKEVVSEQDHRKINSLKDSQDKKDALVFLILSGIKLRHLEVEELLRESKDHEDFNLLSLKSSLIPSKITFLQENFEEKDFKKIVILLDEIELRLLDNGFI